MANGVVYEGDFINDLPHSQNGRFYLPQMAIYQGKVNNGKSSTVGMILYPNGEVYYG
jgi:hypothetical protein